MWTVVCQLRRGRESQPTFHLAAGRTVTVVLCNRLQCQPGPVREEQSCVDNVTSHRILGVDGRAENHSGRATYVYPVFSVKVTCGAVFCTENMSLIRLSLSMTSSPWTCYPLYRYIYCVSTSDNYYTGSLYLWLTSKINTKV